MNPNKLMIVSNLGDELLWGGANLLSSHGWHVVVANEKNSKETKRKEDFMKTCARFGVTSFELFDDIQILAFVTRLKKLAKSFWKIVLTHESSGVHTIVSKAFRSHNVKYFKYGNEMLPQSLIEKKISMYQYYAMQNMQRDHFVKEYIFLKEKLNKIPKLVHQIWFGASEIPMLQKILFEKNKVTLEKIGIDYKLWTAKDMIFENLPITWKAIQKSLEAGKKNNQSRWAQVADLARYEIVYRHGGIYLDSLFEVSTKLRYFIAKLNEKSGFTFIGANEDQCGLECTGVRGMKYLSNGFFAAKPRHIVLSRILDTIEKGKINYNSKFVNRTTGPYLLRTGIHDPIKDKVVLIDTEKIYPFMVNDSKYRKAEPNLCIVSKPDGNNTIKIDKSTYLLNNCLEKKYKGSIAVYNSGYGGSWSW